MFDERHYVPIIKWKRGEQKGLEFLSTELKNRLTPLVEIVPIPYDFPNECLAKSIDEHLINTCEQIQNTWGEKPLFLDLYWVDETERMQNGSHPLAQILEEARERGLHIIPVVGFERDKDYKNEVKIANGRDGHGICIRLEDDDFLSLESNIHALVRELKINPTEVDLIIDFKYINPNDNKKNLLSIVTVINSIPDLERWRTLTFSASAFPENLSSIPPDGYEEIPRSEWLIWKSLSGIVGKIKMMPTFGDYAINNPIYSEIDPRIMRMSANIRYTGEEEFLIFKGKAIRKNGWEQVRTLCQKVIKNPQYCGQEFSWGDKYIFDCASNSCGTGNAETWRRVGTNHHLAYVVNQISTFFGS